MNQAAVDMFWLGSLSELEVAGQQRHHVGLRLWSAEAMDWSQPTHTSDSQFNSRWESSMRLCCSTAVTAGFLAMVAGVFPSSK